MTSTVQSWGSLARRVPTAAVSAGAAVVLCSGVVTALVLPTASDRTSVLRDPVKVTVAPMNGSPAAGYDGQVLHPGDIVTASQGGSGEIVTGARKLLLAATTSSTQVRVDGPASTEIRRGSVVAINPGKLWSLQADQVAVSGVTGAVRIDYGFTVRVADYSGQAVLSVPTGATSRLTGLDQAAASGSVLPGAPVPLRLDDGALDEAAAPSLVTLDRGLTALAGQIDADPNLLASYPSAGENPSESVLPAAIGAAGVGGTAALRAQAASTLRQAQASWGVVAASVGATLPGVRDDLSRLLDSTPAQASAQVAATVPLASPSAPPASVESGPVAARRPVASAAPAPSDRADVTPTSADRPAGVAPTRSAPATPPSRASSSPQPPVASPTPTPAPSALLNSLLNTVGGLLPSALPVRLGQPSPSPGATTDAVSPAPVVSTLVTTVGGVLGRSRH